MNNDRIGFIGLGNMGHPMAKSLEKAGCTLTVYNRTAARMDGFEASTRVVDNITELLLHSDIIFTMLTDDVAAKSVYEQILIHDIAGKLFVDCSTISQDCSIHIAQALTVKKSSLLDAPVAGSTEPARDGTLLFMVGGDQKDLDRVAPYLSIMGKDTKYLGKNGQGLAAKTAVNYFLSILYQGLAEMTLFADSLGLAREAMLDIVNASASGSGATKVKTPLLIAEDFSPAFALDLMLKDAELAADLGARYPAGTAVLNTLKDASANGHGKEDVIAVIEELKKKS
ncbi:NAD(P)-dependent oxidoreductase [Sphingobacterium griseoflavum]|uniref:3-hydroxyisobutyrate dehydrogenase n=1 Tax=Sphingobacterium griseoflavum TaxID=1474952 RepID=A0ABQ3HVP3_9SPHI|nr:NAD(P)-dependent oxidoreductase [Sphingobacterium griseoflavum]GHE31084.1 3-hydroxyisobutyrate dehydrogenase [Sphingobacterium griseoflavum]